MSGDPPEERLLRLIKGKDKSKEKTSSGDSIGGGSLIEAFIKDYFLKKKKIEPAMLTSANRALLLTLILLVGYSLYLFSKKPLDLNSPPLAPGSAVMDAASGPENAGTDSGVPDYSVYSQVVESREGFGGQVAVSGSAAKPVSIDADLSKRFSLVGIIAGDRPQAILEDIEFQKTYNLYENQSMGGITVTAIEEGRVVLDVDGKEVVLVI